MNTQVIDACRAINEKPEEWLTQDPWNAFQGCNDLGDRVGINAEPLRMALRELFLTRMTEAEMLGEVFAHVVREELRHDTEKLASIKAGDTAPDDYMDGNIAMDRAWVMCGCSAIDFYCEGGEGMTQAQCNLWNAAYAHGLTVMEKF